MGGASSILGLPQRPSKHIWYVGYLHTRQFSSILSLEVAGLDLGEQISRAPGRHIGGSSDRWGMRTTSTFKVTGRHVLNLWRVMRAEQSFTSHAFEHVVFQILRRRSVRFCEN